MYYQASISTESTVLGRVRKPSSHVDFCGANSVVSLKDQVWNEWENVCFVRKIPSQTAQWCVWSVKMASRSSGWSWVVVFSSRTTRNAAVHWMKYSPGTWNVRAGYAGDLMAGGVHCCRSGWASKHILHFLLRHNLNWSDVLGHKGLCSNDEFCGLGCLKCRTSASGKILSTQDFLLLCEKSLNS